MAKLGVVAVEAVAAALGMRKGREEAMVLKKNR